MALLRRNWSCSRRSRRLGPRIPIVILFWSLTRASPPQSSRLRDHRRTWLHLSWISCCANGSAIPLSGWSCCVHCSWNRSRTLSISLRRSHHQRWPHPRNKSWRSLLYQRRSGRNLHATEVGTAESGKQPLLGCQAPRTVRSRCPL